VVLLSNVPANRGLPGSVCRRTDAGLASTPPPTGYSSSIFGTAPGYSEWATPTDSSGLPRPSKGVMILIHGGGWFTEGRGAAASTRSRAERWRQRGWTVLNVSSNRSCGFWIDDMLWFYDRVRELQPSARICSIGLSNGGHLALMLAAHRPDMFCAISEAGPTDLVSVASQRAYDPRTGGTQGLGPLWVQEFAIAAFGRSQLADASPQHYVRTINARTLVVLSGGDPFVPRVQATHFVASLDAAHPDTEHRAMILERGHNRWIHGSVTPDALDALWRAEIEIAEE
jgi:dienelactone hydrolase